MPPVTKPYDFLTKPLLSTRRPLRRVQYAWPYLYHKGAKTAQRVFGIPELLELVLQYNGISDVLRMLRVNRRTHDMIEASSKLQIHLCMRAKTSEKMRVFYNDERMSGISWAGQARPVATMDFEHPSPRCDLRKLGMRTIGTRRRKRMLICQPPVFELEIVMCCGSGRTEEHRRRCKSGVTIGNLFEWMDDAKAAHRSSKPRCPREHWFEVVVPDIQQGQFLFEKL